MRANVCVCPYAVEGVYKIWRSAMPLSLRCRLLVRARACYSFPIFQISKFVMRKHTHDWQLWHSWGRFETKKKNRKNKDNRKENKKKTNNNNNKKKKSYPIVRVYGHTAAYHCTVP